MASSDGDLQVLGMGVVGHARLVVPRNMAHAPHREESESFVSARAARAFTLIELLVTIAIIAVLVGLSIAGIGAIRRKAAETGTLSNLRQCAAAGIAYTQDYKDQFPYFFDKDLIRRVSCNGADEKPEPFNFVHQYSWREVLGQGYLGGSCTPLVGMSRMPAGDWFIYPCVYLARPEYWSLSTRSGPDQFGGARLTEVLRPDRKSLFVDPSADSIPSTDPRRSRPGGLRSGFACVDGSSRFLSESNFRRGIESGDGPYPWSWHNFEFTVAISTVNGVRGHDF